MKKFLRDQYDKVLDKINANIAVLKPYLENIQKASTSFLLKLVIVIIIVFSVIWLCKFTWKNLTNQDMFLVSPVTFSFETPDWATVTGYLLQLKMLFPLHPYGYHHIKTNHNCYMLMNQMDPDLLIF